MTEGQAVARLRAALVAPRDAAALAAFRIAFGAIVALSALRFLAYGWVDEFFIQPSFHFHYWGFGWLPVAPGPVIRFLFAALAGLGALVALGLCYRPAVASLFAVFTYLQLLDVTAYLNHYYLVSLLAALLIFVPAHRTWSLDARLRPSLRASALPAWCTHLLRFQVGVVYINAGLAKATSDWLLHAQPLNIWLSARTSLPLIGPYLDRPAVAFAAAWVGFLFDTTIAGCLLWRRSRPFAYLAVLAFHTLTGVLFPSIGMFPVIMMVAALVFFEADWPHRLLARGRAPGGSPPPLGKPVVPTAPPVGPSRWAPIGAAAAAVFLLLQVAIPLRTHLYGGNVLWHEQGMRFSWRVMAREKNGSVTFVVREAATGRRWHVPPAQYLTRVQEREMAVQPDLIQQLARRIAHDFAVTGHPDVTVTADARVSLNGRPAAPFVDPAIDLARAPDGLASKSWILPAPRTMPPLLRPHGSRSL